MNGELAKKIRREARRRYRSGIASVSLLMSFSRFGDPAMILQLIKSKWFWIGLVVLGVVVYSTAKDWAKISGYEKEKKALVEANDKLNTEKKAKETEYNAQMGNLNQATAAIAKQLVTLQQKNQDLIQQNTVLVKQKMDLENAYAKIELREKQIVVPPDRGDRIRLLNSLGY